MAQTQHLTEGKVSKILLGFFFPMLFTNLLQQIYSFADTAIVGKGLGDYALAAVGNISSLSLFIIGFSMGMTNGFSVLIAQSYGAENDAELRRNIAASVKLSVILAIVLTVISLLGIKKIMLAMQTSEMILPDSLRYASIIFGGLIVTVAYNLCACILRALGDSKTPFLAIVISSVINIVLDCVFIFGLKTGVGGAAVATIVAQAVSAVICYAKIRKINILRLTRQDFRNDWMLYRELLKNGMPMACMNSITAIGCMIVQYYVNGLGVAYTSAYSACNKYINLFMLPAITAGFAVSAFTGQNYGAKKYGRIKEGVYVGLGIALVSYLTLGMLMVFCPRQLAGIMLNGETSMELAAGFLRICGSMFFTLNCLFIYRNALQGMGRPFIPMCSGVLEMVLRILVIVVLMPRIGFVAAAVAEVVAWIGALGVNWVAYGIGIWRMDRQI